MKKIVKISTLALLSLGLVGCSSSSSDYDPNNSYGRERVYEEIVSQVDRGEYKITLNNNTEVLDFIESVDDADFKNIDYIKKQNKNAVIIKFKSSQKNLEEDRVGVQQKIIEKDGKKYKVIIEEIVDNSVDEIANKAVEEVSKTSK